MAKNFKVAIFILSLLVFMFLYNQSQQNQYISSEVRALDIAPDLISSFSISDQMESITIARIDTTWEIKDVDSLTIKQSSINNFFDKVLLVNKGTMVSNNKDNWSQYSVHDTNSIHLSLLDKDEKLLGEFFLGRSKSSQANNNIRVNGEVNVFLTTENISYYLSTQPEAWGEKPIPDIPVVPAPTR